MLLRNLLSIPEEQHIDVLIEKGGISSVSEDGGSLSEDSNSPIIKFQDAIIFPGLINSHDHLDFNLFPQLGNRIYNNYVEWGEDIHQQNKDVINSALKVPKELRIQWGLYKNLLNGITTVVNHGPTLSAEDSPIAVWQKSHVLHSVQLEKRWRYKLNMPFIKKWPFSIHIGEGTDKATESEINELIKWNFFNRELIGIHAIAMNGEQATHFKAIVWCPDSNYFLVGKTAAINKLKHHTKILLGTDSTVSSNWNLWSHIRHAREGNMMTDSELFNMLTSVPAAIWKIPNSGKIAEGYSADVVIGRKKSTLKGMDAFFTLNPEDILMVTHKGNIRLFDEDIYRQLSDQRVPLQSFSKVYLNGRCKYIYGDILQLIKSIKGYYPEAKFPITC